MPLKWQYSILSIFSIISWIGCNVLICIRISSLIFEIFWKRKWWNNPYVYYCYHILWLGSQEVSVLGQQRDASYSPSLNSSFPIHFCNTPCYLTQEAFHWEEHKQLHWGERLRKWLRIQKYMETARRNFWSTPSIAKQ